MTLTLTFQEDIMTSDKYSVLSIKYGGHDTAAALMIDGELIAACEQERYTRDKHSRLFPIDAVNDCLKIGNLTIDDIDELAFVNDLKYFIRETYLKPALQNDDRLGFLIKDIDIIKTNYEMEDTLRRETSFKGKITYRLHHLCHLASSYYPSGFSEALLVSYDGIGEIETGMIGLGKNGKIEIVHSNNHNPHSLGLLYSAVTFFLGWKHHCDEGIIMGLAPYGNPHAKIPGRTESYYDIFCEILKETGDYDFEVNQEWMAYYRIRDTWVSDKFKEVFGQKREYQDELTQHHKDIAAALQYRLEEVVLNQLKKARAEFGMSKIALAGGVCLNCSMNGKILASGLFDEVFVQPAAGDAGTTIGACYLAHQEHSQNLVPVKMHNFYKGSRAEDEQLEKLIQNSSHNFKKPDDIYTYTAQKLNEGKIIAWFQGASEFGPRALGNRSILCKPYPASMKDHLNKQVKFREEFRPFAPAVMAEYATDYFEVSQESPHMLMAVQVRKDKRDKVPAIVHVDGSCRVQTVKPENNERFYKLLHAFHKLTEVPVLLNTSFNVKGQPIVNTPQEAIDCYLSTKIDCLIVGDYVLEKE